MTGIRHIILLCFTYVIAWDPAYSSAPQTDSLRLALESTSNTKKKIELLIDLKDINEDNDCNLLYSQRLFTEAQKANDAYAMWIAATPYIIHFATYPEKQDSIDYYIGALQSATNGTPMADHCHFWEDYRTYRQLTSDDTQDSLHEACQTVLKQIKTNKPHESKAQKVGRLFLTGLINTLLSHDKKPDLAMARQIPIWTEAWNASAALPIDVCKQYQELIYYHLSKSYSQLKEYGKLIDITNRYIATLDKYYTSETIKNRRKYLYKGNLYILCYKQLLKGALSISEDEAYKYYNQFRSRMMTATGRYLERNKMAVYEVGYIFMGDLNRPNDGVAYCDSLISLIESSRRNVSAKMNVYKDRARLLRRAGRLDEACAAYVRAIDVNDSMKSAEYNKRLDNMRRNSDFEKLMLEETQLKVTHRRALIILSACILLALLLAGIHYRKVLKKTKKLQAAIMRHTQKAGESERMKSVFLNSLCGEISAPFEAINTAVEKLTASEMPPEENKNYNREIAENTKNLTQIMERLLEAAKLTVLSDGLPLKKVDIAEICRMEMAAASNRPDIEYRIDNCQQSCIAYTNPRYFALVLQALLSNANKFTSEGSITISGHKDMQSNRLSVIISDTGCGIPADKVGYVFENFTQLDHKAAGHGMGLPICRLIARALHGDLTIDTSYTEGARFIFTIPITYNPE